jgi:hypothetical protein
VRRGIENGWFENATGAEDPSTISGNQTKAARLLVVARQEGIYCVKKFLAELDL